MAAAPAEVIDVERKVAAFTEQWSPKIVAEANGWHVKLVKASGRFVYHRHDVDELFFVLSGTLTIDLRDGETREVHTGELYVVPAGVEHRPNAGAYCAMALLEPVRVPNTGDTPGSRTAEDVWL